MKITDMKIDNDWRPSPDSMLDTFVEWYNENNADFDVKKLTREEAYVVWFCYTVGNAKALISTTRPDHMYYEMTYSLGCCCDNATDCIFVDQYFKVKHSKIEKGSEE